MYFCVLKVAVVRKCRDVSLISSSKAGPSTSSSFKTLYELQAWPSAKSGDYKVSWHAVLTCCVPNAWVFSSWQVLDPTVPSYRTKKKMLVQNNVCWFFGHLPKQKTKINETILYVTHGYIKEGFTMKHCSYLLRHKIEGLSF